MFSKEYWKSSADKLKSVRYLALMAVFIAVRTIISGAFIPVGDNLRVYFGFLFTAVEACILGPVGAMLSGGITDIVSFMLFPSGPFFFGYTLSSILGGLIYALFLYRKRVTILRLAGAKFFVNYLVNVLLGSIWSAMLYSKGYIYYLGKSVIKNTMMLPIEVLMLTAVFNVLLPILKNRKLLSAPQDPAPVRFR